MLLPQDLFAALSVEDQAFWPQLVFRWAPKSGKADLVLRMHALRWSTEQAQAFLANLNAQHAQWAAFSWEKGEVQIQFQKAFWMELMQGLDDVSSAWLSLSDTMPDVISLEPLPEIVLLARRLQDLEGWEMKLDEQQEWQPETWESLREMLYFTTLQADSEAKRQYWLKWLRKLWNKPLLFAPEPVDSFCRLQMLRYWLSLLKSEAEGSVE